MSVLILATAADEHAAAVAAELRRSDCRAEVVDVSAFPQRARLIARYECCEDCGGRSFALALEHTRLELEEFGSVWWRRPQHPEISPEIAHAAHRQFAATEAYEAITGVWHALDAFWVNDPARDHVAHRKAYQLRVAQDAGLRIPHTLITNDADEARRFVDARGYRDVIYKAFSATERDWRETRLLRPGELALLDNVRYAPVIFQEYVRARYDVRVTVVGDELFAAAIHSQDTEYPVDFRMDIANARIEPVSLPEDVREGLRDLMTRLGLVYGAADLRLTPDDDYVFLEINPAGQWLFVEQQTGQPIAAALARVLRDRDRAIAA
jgi:glutathione synthase/RimK-type ligase-like ATP-grasp enzyme